MERSGFKSYFCSKEGNGVNKVVMLNSFQDLHRFKSASKEEIPDQVRDDNRRRAFTLIELLVVVLIIGILAAVAVPQYQMAVEKSRAAEAWIALKNWEVASNLYYLTHGTYQGMNESNIDIEIPSNYFVVVAGDSRTSESGLSTSVSMVRSGNLYHIVFGFSQGKKVYSFCKTTREKSLPICRSLGASNCTTIDTECWIDRINSSSD